ncbi:uracil-DNA glycosylase family protein [Psychroserpens sp. Hel_I_66]|uniref:uracil-DNA glycosylase family protein n=1 Tax=Psychroserpens sp. Hel_I_66 TaxID=1250004 RepID=UPI00064822B3|nr:uracil-DNA glycosylase family protein [Psychroserpens sp. Hel_I_66]
MQDLLHDIRQCSICEPHLPLGAKPIVEAHKDSKIVLLSQAPGRVAHQKGMAWDDASGKRLRDWLGVDEDTFYNPNNFAIMPMGFCYPGKGKGGDLPPRPECAPTWHDLLWKELKSVELIILIGAYAQKQYLKKEAKRTLTETVANYESYLPKYFPLPHPSPRNRFWLTKNPWFEEEVLGELKMKVNTVI